MECWGRRAPAYSASQNYLELSHENYIFRLVLYCVPSNGFRSQAELDLRKVTLTECTPSAYARPFPDSALSVPPMLLSRSVTRARRARFVQAIGTATLAPSNTLLGFSTKIPPIPAELCRPGAGDADGALLDPDADRTEYQHIMRLAVPLTSSEQARALCSQSQPTTTCRLKDAWSCSCASSHRFAIVV
jgi:hypothetical protein